MRKPWESTRPTCLVVTSAPSVTNGRAARTVSQAQSRSQAGTGGEEGRFMDQSVPISVLAVEQASRLPISKPDAQARVFLPSRLHECAAMLQTADPRLLVADPRWR